MSLESLVKDANLTMPQIDALAAAIKAAMQKVARDAAEERGEQGYDMEGPPQPMPPNSVDPGMQAPGMQPQMPQQPGPQMAPPQPQMPPQQPQPDEIIRRQMLQAAQRGIQPGILNRMG